MRSKAYMSQINLQHGTTTDRGQQEEWKTKEWKRICSEVSVNSPGNPWSQSRRKKVGYGGKDLQKRKVLSLEWKSEGVMDDESGESMKLMEEMPLKELGEAELERLVWVDGGEPGVDSRDEGKRTGRNDLLFVKKMM